MSTISSDTHHCKQSTVIFSELFSLKFTSVDTLLQTEKHKLLLFAANRKRKWQTSIGLLQTELENGRFFSLVGKG
jgi:hypothetical protein